MAQELFEQTNLENGGEPLVVKEGEPTFLEQLVGEGKKFGTQEDLAKGKLESDRYIGQLQTELEESRTALQKATTLDEFMTKMEQRQITPSTPEDTPLVEAVDKVNSIDEAKVTELLNSRLSEMQQQNTVNNNISAAASKMKEMWGNDAKLKLNEKARELGMPFEELEGFAKSNLGVFYNLIGANTPAITQVAQATPIVTNPGINTTSVPVVSGNTKNYVYYEKLRKENPKEFRRQQTEMHKQAVDQGANFYS